MSRILAVDVGFASCGVAVLERGGQDWKIVALDAFFTSKCDRKQKLYVAHDDARRVGEMARKIINLISEHDVKRMVVELPSAGGQSADAVRAMALASGMIATIAEGLSVAVEYYTGQETRIAAAGKSSATKPQVIKAIEARWGFGIFDKWGFTNNDQREAAADALATFDAARAGNLLKL